MCHKRLLAGPAQGTGLQACKALIHGAWAVVVTLLQEPPDVWSPHTPLAMTTTSNRSGFVQRPAPHAIRVSSALHTSPMHTGESRRPQQQAGLATSDQQEGSLAAISERVSPSILAPNVVPGGAHAVGKQRWTQCRDRGQQSNTSEVAHAPRCYPAAGGKSGPPFVCCCMLLFYPARAPVGKDSNTQ